MYLIQHYCILIILMIKFCIISNKEINFTVNVTNHSHWTGVNVTCLRSTTVVSVNSVPLYDKESYINNAKQQLRQLNVRQNNFNNRQKRMLTHGTNINEIEDDSNIESSQVTTDQSLTSNEETKIFHQHNTTSISNRDSTTILSNQDNTTSLSNKDNTTSLSSLSNHDTHSISSLETEDNNMNRKYVNKESSSFIDVPHTIQTRKERIRESSIVNTTNDLVLVLQSNEFGSDKDIQAWISGCTRLVLHEGVVSNNVHHLTLTSDGSIVFTQHWANTATNLKKVAITAARGLYGLGSCGWWPLNITSLDLSHMPLQHLNISGCFTPPETLETLRVVGTGLVTAHLCTPSLSLLDVSWNDLSSLAITMSCSNGLAGIKELHASHNKMTHWSLCNWDDIHIADLSHNQIVDLDLKSCHSKYLTELRLPYNKLVYPPQQLPKSLNVLDLSHNNLGQLPIIPATLKEVDFSHNAIQELPSRTLKHARNLLILDLSHNSLSKISGRSLWGMREARELDLSHNELKHIEADTFIQLHHLTTLKLQYNKLAQVDPRVLLGVSDMTHIILHHNPWRCSCTLLAAITTAVRSHCLPHCHDHELTCEEGSRKPLASEVLTWCIRAVEGVQGLHDDISDEDLSEEDVDHLVQKSPYVLAIPGVIIILLVAVSIGMTRTLYRRRNKLRRYCPLLHPLCNCLAPMSANGVPSERSEDIEFDTEMSPMASSNYTTSVEPRIISTQ